MTRPQPDDVSPERLAELADGSPPCDAAERELMALMAEVRDLEEPAPDALRARVRAIAAGEAGPERAHRWQEGRRRLLLFGAPVAAGVVALAIAIPVMTRDSGEPAPAAATSEALAGDSAAPAAPEAAAGSAAIEAPGAARAVAPSTADAPAAVGQARAEIGALGGSVVSEAGDGRIVRLVVRVPGDRAAEAVAALRRLGEVTGRRKAMPPPAGDVTIRVTITTGG